MGIVFSPSAWRRWRKLPPEAQARLKQKLLRYSTDPLKDAVKLSDSKIQVHAFYCVLAWLLTSLLQRELARKGEPLSINRMLEELGAIRETLVVYPRRPGQRQAPTATCLTRMTVLQQRLFSLLSLQRFVPVIR